ncbi:MAG TPA: C4-dicarboxylate ABC transporter permease, partial [Rhodospirillales bacterium]|nr:C4-dicarboxylate ABC transporter permease [Rhodospirillales bacterium]
MSPDVLDGLAQASQFNTIIAVAVGCFIGLVVGMIPGLTISTGIIIVLPLTFVLSPEISIALLLGLYVSGMTGGSFSAILLNIPGTPSASATAMDGNPMARNGEAGRAMGIAIVASFFGGFFSFLCLFFVAPLLAEVALQFQSPDLFSLVFFGLTIICSFAAKSLIKGFLSAALGLAIVTVGQDPMMGTHRFTFGEINLIGGIHFLTALIGLFAIPQLVDNFTELINSNSGSGAVTKIRSVIPSFS